MIIIQRHHDMSSFASCSRSRVLLYFDSCLNNFLNISLPSGRFYTTFLSLHRFCIGNKGSILLYTGFLFLFDWHPFLTALCPTSLYTLASICIKLHTPTTSSFFSLLHSLGQPFCSVSHFDSLNPCSSLLFYAIGRY
jgi:hypothetical protein